VSGNGSTPLLCQGCGAPLTRKRASGRPPKWCSDYCRKWTLYSQPCVEYGTPTNGSDGLVAEPRCVPCAARKNGAERRVWTRELVIERIREWTERYGEPPATPDWSPIHARGIGDEERARHFEDAWGYWPWFTVVVRLFGSWNAGIRAAGFEPRACVGTPESERRKRRYRERAVA
jgi:hypothetical protein